ncbi:MAG TPA: hypothetical protein VHK06_05075, partial [Candidatus Limnocylindria bacterium]|nr:hypothetical protein [Candidatus Limnocylindria bacterium]
MYPWLVFIHIAGVLAFTLAHGASVSVMFAIRSERSRPRIRTLLALSGASMTGFYVSIAVLLAGGVLAGFIGNWWRMLWIWLSLGLFVAIMAAMFPLARSYFRRVSHAVETR